jgi:NACalpha-BTF3-like transcription factor
MLAQITVEELIAVVMLHGNASRELAIYALKTYGGVVDAIMYLTACQRGS